MARPERPVDPYAGEIQRFAHDLRCLRNKAGRPPYRALSERAHYSVTTLAEAARGLALPSLAVTLAYVRTCDGDLEAWERRWRTLSATLAEEELKTQPGEAPQGQGDCASEGGVGPTERTTPAPTGAARRLRTVREPGEARGLEPLAPSLKLLLAVSVGALIGSRMPELLRSRAPFLRR